MQQRSAVTIFNLAQQSFRNMKADLGFFSSSEDKKTVLALRNFLTDQNATDKDIINAFNQVKATSSNPKFKVLSQQFLSKATSIENYLGNNTSPMTSLFFITDVMSKIFNFIPGLKMFPGTSQLPLPNRFWLTQFSLVCKRMYLAVRAFRQTECEDPVDKNPKSRTYLKLFGTQMVLDQACVNQIVSQDEDLLVEYAKYQPSVTTTIDTACGYCELSLTESQILDFKAGTLKIKFIDCERAYFSVTCSDYKASSRLHFPPVSYYYVDHEHKQFVKLVGFDALFSSDSYVSTKKAIKDRYVAFLCDLGLLSDEKHTQNISITNSTIMVTPMILAFDEWNFFNRIYGAKRDLFVHNKVQFKLKLIDQSHQQLFSEVVQDLYANKTNISGCQTFLNFDEKKLWLFYQTEWLYDDKIRMFYLNEWSLSTGKLKVHELDLSGLRIRSVSRRQDLLHYSVGSISILNSRYVIFKVSSEQCFIKPINHYISVFGIIAYDLEKNRIAYEKYFSLNGTGPYLDFIENLPDDNVQVQMLSSGSVVISGPSCVVTIDFPVPLKKDPVFDADDHSEGTQDNSSAISSLEIAFYVGLLFLFIALVTMTIMSGVFAFAFSLGCLLVIPFSAFIGGFLLGYLAGEAFLVGDVFHKAADNLATPVLENRSRDEGNRCNLLNGICETFGGFFSNVSEKKEVVNLGISPFESYGKHNL